MTDSIPAGAECDITLQLDNQFCFALYALSRKITALYRPLLQPLGLTYPQYLVMLVLWEAEAGPQQDDYEGVTVKHLCDRLQLDTGTLTPLLKRLEGGGMLRRNRSRSDEREVRIRLTAAGAALKEKARHIPMQMICNSALPLDRILPLQQELRTLLLKVADKEETRGLQTSA